MTVRNRDSSTSTSRPRARLQGMGPDTWTWTTPATANQPRIVTKPPVRGTTAMNGNVTSRATTARRLATHPPERR
jgi:hypothetical protein